MIFRKRKKKNEEPIEITLRNQIISHKESTQFLRMILKSRLNQEKHIDRGRAKAKRGLILSKLQWAKSGENTEKHPQKTLQCNIWIKDNYDSQGD